MATVVKEGIENVLSMRTSDTLFNLRLWEGEVKWFDVAHSVVLNSATCNNGGTGTNLIPVVLVLAN